MIRQFLWLLFLAFLSEPALPQAVIQGTVKDALTGTTLPAATIQIEGTYTGTIANADGEFSILAEQYPVVLIVRYLGYQPKTVLVASSAELPVLIELNPAITEMDELVVTDRDPALSIMERVIERKKIWRGSLHTFKADAYTRQLLRNDTSIVSITESSSQLFWKQAGGLKEIQTYRKQTLNLQENQNFAGVQSIPNLYDDNIEILGYNLVGVTHPDALQYYQFILLETTSLEDKPLYKIEVLPRRKLQPLFEGRIWVSGHDYALLEVDLHPNDVVRFPPPIQQFNLSYKQQYSDFGGDYRLPVDMRIEGLLEIGMPGLSIPEIHFSQVSRITDYQINTEIPDSIFQQDSDFVRQNQDSLATETEREGLAAFIPLTVEEELAYETIDSTNTLEEAFKPEGFLARMAESSNREGRANWLGNIIPDGLGLRGRYNRIDGLHAGLKYENNIPGISAEYHLFGGYSLNSGLWDYGAEVTVALFNRQNYNFGLLAGYKNQTDTRYESDIYSVGISSLMIVFGGTDYFDYFRNEERFAGLSASHHRLNIEARLTWQSEHHKSFSDTNIQDYSLFGWHEPRRENPDIFDGNMNSLKLNLNWNKTNRLFGFSGARQLFFELETSRDFFGSDFNFTTLRMSGDWQFATFYQRRLFSNTLDIHFSAGTSFGEVPIQKFAAVDGSRNRFTPFGVLRSRTYLPYEGTEYASLVAEHNFRTIPFELLGLHYFADKGWGMILFGGAGITDVNTRFEHELMLSDGFHTEMGISLNNIFGVARLDVAKQIGGAGFFVGISVPRYF